MNALFKRTCKCEAHVVIHFLLIALPYSKSIVGYYGLYEVIWWYKGGAFLLLDTALQHWKLLSSYTCSEAKTLISSLFHIFLPLFFPSTSDLKMNIFLRKVCDQDISSSIVLCWWAFAFSHHSSPEPPSFIVSLSMLFWAFYGSSKSQLLPTGLSITFSLSMFSCCMCLTIL